MPKCLQMGTVLILTRSVVIHREPTPHCPPQVPSRMLAAIAISRGYFSKIAKKKKKVFYSRTWCKQEFPELKLVDRVMSFHLEIGNQQRAIAKYWLWLRNTVSEHSNMFQSPTPLWWHKYTEHIILKHYLFKGIMLLSTPALCSMLMYFTIHFHAVPTIRMPGQKPHVAASVYYIQPNHPLL